MDKKTFERSILKAVAQQYPACPKENQCSDSESPDFLCSQDGTTIGIEIVEYVRGQNPSGSSMRRDEELHERIADQARQIFDSNFPNEHLYVLLHWYPRKPLRSGDVKGLSQAVAALVGQYLPKSRSYAQSKIEGAQLRGTPLDGLLISISVLRVKYQTQALWATMGGGFISVTYDEIRGIIQAKEALLSTYRGNCATCHEFWLIIAAAGVHLSSQADTSLLNCPMPSQFDRVLFYDEWAKAVTVLHPPEVNSNERR